MSKRPDELDDFKRQINLTQYAAACGYQLDRKASSRNSAVMRHPAGDKIIVAKGPDGHWLYLCARYVTYFGGASPLRTEVIGTARLGKGVHREVESEES